MSRPGKKQSQKTKLEAGSHGSKLRDAVARVAGDVGEDSESSGDGSGGTVHVHQESQRLTRII